METIDIKNKKWSDDEFYKVRKEIPVSYTHLDVYKRQIDKREKFTRLRCICVLLPV